MLLIINITQKKNNKFGIMQIFSYYCNIIKKLTSYETFSIVICIDCIF
jgi:hypothetical protein